MITIKEYLGESENITEFFKNLNKEIDSVISDNNNYLLEVDEIPYWSYKRDTTCYKMSDIYVEDFSLQVEIEMPESIYKSIKNNLDNLIDLPQKRTIDINEETKNWETIEVEFKTNMSIETDNCDVKLIYNIISK